MRSEPAAAATVKESNRIISSARSTEVDEGRAREINRRDEMTVDWKTGRLTSFRQQRVRGRVHQGVSAGDQEYQNALTEESRESFAKEWVDTGSQITRRRHSTESRKSKATTHCANSEKIAAAKAALATYLTKTEAYHQTERDLTQCADATPEAGGGSGHGPMRPRCLEGGQLRLVEEVSARAERTAAFANTLIFGVCLVRGCHQRFGSGRHRGVDYEAD